jgi:serine/threonine protein kinase
VFFSSYYSIEENSDIVPAELFAMDSIGPYRIERTVGVGGLSTVYAALDPRNGRRVAIKVASTTVDSPDHQWVLNRFRRESSLVTKLKHPAIVSISDVGVLPDGSPYVVSEWVEGRRLDEILRAGHVFPLRIALFIAEQIAGALGAAHSLGFVHSDVKPGNIVVQDQNPSSPLSVKLMDFGVAGELEHGTQSTRAGVLIGSPYYMSPEQIRAGELSPSSDIWALGVVLFEMVTGQRAFAGETSAGVIWAVMNAKTEIPEGVNLPPPVAAFLMRCLDKVSEQRPADGNEAAKEIRKLRAELPPEIDLRADIEESNRSVLKSAAASPVSPMVATHPQLRPAASGSLLWFVAAITLIALGGALFFFFRYTLFAPRPWSGVALGVSLALGGSLLGRAIQKLLAARQSAISAEVQGILTGARTQSHLSRTLAIQVDEIVSKCRLIDERFLAMTMAVMVEEYSEARAFDDRQKALMNAVALLEKLMPKLSPWYVRNDKLIGFVVTLLGLLSGLTTVAQNLAKMIKGT